MTTFTCTLSEIDYLQSSGKFWPELKREMMRDCGVDEQTLDALERKPKIAGVKLNLWPLVAILLSGALWWLIYRGGFWLFNAMRRFL